MKKLRIAVGIALAGLAGALVAPVASQASAPVSTSGGHGHARECATPSIDRLQQWLASGEGTTVPASGSLLVPQRGGKYAAKVTFVNAEWHVVVVWLGNQFEAQADLSRSAGFWLTYSATEDLYLQLRPASNWGGGDKWLTLVPSTRGREVTRFFSFAPQRWTTLPELGTPAYSFASALTEARGFVFVGKTANELTFRGLKIHRYTPPCR
jgi:hypothetical protein